MNNYILDPNYYQGKYLDPYGNVKVDLLDQAIFELY